MSTLLDHFRQNWDNSKFCNSGQTILAAVSGGVDSMVMIDLLLKCNISFAVAHCNFQLRGAESDGDEELVANWCVKNNINIHQIKFPTGERAAEWKKGTQETARILRYEWFSALRTEHGYVKTATAHHADDNVETLLINLCRGTGIAGLHGILPDANGIIRPLLFAQKAELATWAAAQNVPYREDASNAGDDYLRNAIRHKLVPVLDELFPNATAQINESIMRFHEVEELYEKAIKVEKKRLIEQRGKDYYIPLRKLKLAKPLNTICYELIKAFDFSAAQVPHVLALISASSGRVVNSPTHRIIRDREFLVITALPGQATDFHLVEQVPCTIVTATSEFTFSVKDTPDNLPKEPNIACIDLAALEFPLILRKWKIGDYFYPLGMSMKKKKVSRILINDKVPLHKKEQVYVLECQKKIIWLTGFRLDERFKVTSKTKQVLVVKMCDL